MDQSQIRGGAPGRGGSEGHGGSVSGDGGTIAAAGSSGRGGSGADDEGGASSGGSAGATGGEDTFGSDRAGAAGESTESTAAPASGGATSNEGGRSGTGSGGSNAATGGTSSCTLPTEGEACSNTVPKKSRLIAFDTYDVATGEWGNSDNGDITGGTSLYHGANDTALTLEVSGAGADAALHVTGSVSKGGYAGFVLWFGPCVTASLISNEAEIEPEDTPSTFATTGLSTTLGGTLGGASLKFQVQTNEDYPVDAANNKGGCVYSTCGAQWSECAGPVLTVMLPETATETEFAWNDFASGKPVAQTSGDGLVGLQFQVECSASDSDCAVDLTIGSIDFTTE